MKRFTITIISAMLCGLVVLSACGGAKKNVQDAGGKETWGPRARIIGRGERGQLFCKDPSPSAYAGDGDGYRGRNGSAGQRP